MSATTDKLVIPSIENKSFDDQFSDDVDMGYDDKREFGKVMTFYVNRADLSKGATRKEIFEYYYENKK